MKLFKQYKAAAYLPNLYTLLQYLLLNTQRMEDTLFFIHQKFPILVVPGLSESDFLRGGSKFQILFSAAKIYWLILWNRNLPIYLGGDLLFTHVFLRCSKNTVYLEDGAASYEVVYEKERQMRTKRKNWWARLLMGDVYPWFGLADNVRTIYLTGILPIPEIIADKVELINMKQLWFQKTREEQEVITHIFLPAESDRNLIREYDVFLLTQPFSEISGGCFSEEEKIEVYRKLVAQYNESELVIKTHPAEITDYSKYFPKARIIDLPCPLELLILLGLRAQTVISVNSTAILGLEDFQEKIVSGYDVTPALKREAIRRGIYGGVSNKSMHIGRRSESSNITVTK